LDWDRKGTPGLILVLSQLKPLLVDLEI